jgi:hypothetical protein
MKDNRKNLSLELVNNVKKFKSQFLNFLTLLTIFQMSELDNRVNWRS